MVMKDLMIFAIAFFMSLPAWAMTSLADTDLSEVSHPQSIMAEISKDTGSAEDSRPGILKKFYNNSKMKSAYSLISLEIDGHLDVNESIEDEAYGGRLTLSSDQRREDLSQQKSLLIDQINGKWRDMVYSEDNSDMTATTVTIKDTNPHTLFYRDGSRNSTTDSYSYRLYFNNTEMRDTFIQQRGTDIRSGSWVDIKVR